MRNTACTCRCDLGSSRRPAKDSREGLSVCTDIIISDLLSLMKGRNGEPGIVFTKRLLNNHSASFEKKGHRVSFALWPLKKPSGEDGSVF